MSKALVITMNDGTAIKWAGKYHNHLAKVSPSTGRIEQFLPVRIRRFMREGADFFAVTRDGTEQNLIEPFRSHREALEWIASTGLYYVHQEAGNMSFGVIRKDFAEDLLNASQMEPLKQAA
jgi:hypothetical protein